MTQQRTDTREATVTQGARRRTRDQVLAVAGLAVLVAAFLAVAAERHGFFDLKVYSGALRFWAREGGEIYDYIKPNSTYGFTYPPFAALTMLPMAYLPWPVTIALSVTATVVVSAVLLWWLVDPVARTAGWTRWCAFAVAFCLAAAFEPMRETVNFGQVNMLLLFLVAADLLWLVADRPPTARPLPFGPGLPPRWRALAGVGVGLATAVKLTPGIFIVYLLVTRRFRAAGVAVLTAAVATLFAGAVAVDASREFWTSALWNTDRVGSLAFISNQSLQGVVARLDPAEPSRLLWLASVLAALTVWVWRSRRAVAAGDEVAGLALTGVVGCLVSPVTWVHHLVWLIPALVLLVDEAVRAPADSRRRGVLLTAAGLAYAVLISRLVWRWEDGGTGPVAFLGANAYVWVSVGLLLGLPVRRAAQPVESGGVPDLVQPDRRPSPGQVHLVGRPPAVGGQPGPLVEPAGP
jgi:alpha-1,2-mannosyltransferase